MELREITTGLLFPEGPVALPDGSVLVVEIARRCVTRVRPDGGHEIVARPGGGPNGLAIGPDGKLLRVQQRRLRVHLGRGLRHPPGAPGLGLLGRPDRADRPCERRGRGAVPRHLAGAAARAERHRVRRPRRLLLHRPRQGARSRLGPRRRVLRQGRRLADQGGRVPAGHAERHRPLARRQHPLRRRDRGGAPLGLADPRARRAGQGALAEPARRPPGRPARRHLPAVRFARRSRRTATSASRP